MKRITLLLVPALAFFLLFSLLSGGADGAAIAIDDMTHTPQEPTIEDSVTVTAAVVPVDADIIDEGVVLVWSMCTDSTCDLPNYETMTDNGDGTWSATISNMPTTSSTGDPYIELKFHVEVTALPNDGSGSEEFTEDNDQVTLALKEIQGPADDDDDTTDDDTTDDDDDDSEDSPVGAGILLGAVITASLAFFNFRRRDH